MISLAELQKLLPELMGTVRRRYALLDALWGLQPVGRRVLAAHLGWTEREVRSDTDLLREQQLIAADASGMRVTGAGKRALLALRDQLGENETLRAMEHKLHKLLGVRSVRVMMGDAEADTEVLSALGFAAAEMAKQFLHDHMVVSVTGGATMEQVSHAMETERPMQNVLVVPARGGLGRVAEHQANVIATEIAHKIGGRYMLLHLPDEVEPQTRAMLLKEPAIRSVLDAISESELLIYGIGRAEAMMQRRGLSREAIDIMLDSGAAAEAVGYYFNPAGEVVGQVSSTGIELETLRAVPHLIGVAGGASKAEAILAVAKAVPTAHLVMDESAAEAILASQHQQA